MARKVQQGSAQPVVIYDPALKKFLQGAAQPVVLYDANGVALNYSIITFPEVASSPANVADYGQIYTKSDNQLYFRDGDGEEHVLHGFPTTKSYTGTTQGLGAGADIYVAGFYEAPTADANLSQAGATQTYIGANLSKSAHAFIVAGDAGTVDTGQVGLRATGTSITDQAVRTVGDSEVLTTDITTLATDQYLETDKKWLGTITFELYVVSGTPTAYTLDFNYGIAKYDDYYNEDFTITDIECVGEAGANDANFNITLIHHRQTGWTYSAAAFNPITAARTIASLVGDHSTDDQLVNGGYFAWKRDNLSQMVEGSNNEGYLIYIETTGTNVLEFANIHVGVQS